MTTGRRSRSSSKIVGEIFAVSTTISSGSGSAPLPSKQQENDNSNVVVVAADADAADADADADGVVTSDQLLAAHNVWELMCGYAIMDNNNNNHNDNDNHSGRSLLHTSSNAPLIQTLLERAYQLDQYSHQSQSSSSQQQWLATMLVQQDQESGYTPLHWAIYKSKLTILLLLLRYTAALVDHQHQNHDGDGDGGRNTTTTTTATSTNKSTDSCIVMTRSVHRPLTLLQQGSIGTGADGWDNKNNRNNSSSSSRSNTSTSTTASAFLSKTARQVLSVRDKEGLTPAQLLALLQVKELTRCRDDMIFSPHKTFRTTTTTTTTTTTRLRQQQQQQEEEQGQDELATLSNFIQLQQQQQQQGSRPVSIFSDYSWDHNYTNSTSTEYACEVLSFGRSNHLALGVPGAGKKTSVTATDVPAVVTATTTTSTSTTTASTTTNTNTTSNNNNINKHYSSFRPHRIQEFAQEQVGRMGSAIAVAAAAHHTLILTRQGQLYACGLGTGGRLGTSQNEYHSPLPTRISYFVNAQLRVVSIAAAENHSLCVTSNGAVYAFGSNRFGQLGYSTTTSASAQGNPNNRNESASSSRSCLPRRVDDLWKKKRALCISVAAGEKHSVALSQQGEVFVWGCNSSGQLGITSHASNSNTHNSNTSNQMTHKVQRVEALWNNNNNSNSNYNNKSRPYPKQGLQIAASSHSTLVLVKAKYQFNSSSDGLPHHNQVYAWGHGNCVPSRIRFVNREQQEQDFQRRRKLREQLEQQPREKFTLAFLDPGRADSVGNPVAISCAKYHNAVITDNGKVYTWGFHADPLGGQSSSSPSATTTPTKFTFQPKKRSNYDCSQPQLVTGMLPENGGGFAVAVSASENHTAVVTKDGALYTWGASYGKSVLGHEGVRFQPIPKRVMGVSRAVDVCAAKDHTVLLMGTSFPNLHHKTKPEPELKAGKATKIPALAQLAAVEVAKHVDMFNVLPILIMAERTNSEYLVEYCEKFVELNLDGVLNVAQKSTLDTYLNEQLSSGLLLLDSDPRDRRDRPLAMRIALGQVTKKSSVCHESETVLSDPLQWIKSCEKLSKKDSIKQLLYRMRKEAVASENSVSYSNTKLRRRSSSSIGSYTEAYGDGTNSAMRRRSSSNASDGQDRKMSSSERCIMLTTKMDLSTRELVQSKHDTLAKEIRGLKKRLNQIAKLELLLQHEQDGTEATEIALSMDQKDKIARRPQLESELCIFDAAMAKVERRMAQYNLRPRRLSSGGDTDDAKLKDDSKWSDGPKLTESPELHNGKSEKIEASASTTLSLRCSTCNISCPDETSYALHMSGRKHRNRTAQVVEDEKKQAAAALIAENHRQQLQGNPHKEIKKPPPVSQSAWSKALKPAKSKYKLPSPSSHPFEIVDKKEKSKSLQEIMLEEALTQAPAPAASVAGSLRLPPGSAPAMKSPPWASSRSTPNKATMSLQSTPLQLPKSSSTMLPSPACGFKAVASSLPGTGREFPTLGSPQASGKIMVAFGDFLCNKPTPPMSAKKSSSTAPWAYAALAVKRPGFGDTPLVSNKKSSSNTGASFEAIQREEEEFKSLQDKTYQDDGKWYIGRRERAGSITAIQQAEQEERDRQLMIEDQKKIEAEIYRQIAEQKKKQVKKMRQQQRTVKKLAKNSRTTFQSRPSQSGKKETSMPFDGVSTESPKSNKIESPNNQRKRKGKAKFAEAPNGGAIDN